MSATNGLACGPQETATTSTVDWENMGKHGKTWENMGKAMDLSINSINEDRSQMKNHQH